MRKVYIFLAIAVIGIVGTAYGINSLVYHFNKGLGLNVPALVLLILGIICLILFLIISIGRKMSEKKKQNSDTSSIVEQKEEKKDVVQKQEAQKETTIEEKNEQKIAETIKEEKIIKEKDTNNYESAPKQTRYSYSSYSASTVYVKLVGYGPLIRVEGSRIIDMRTNTYYRIENNFVYEDGSGLRYEIRGNQIKDCFGSYLYELSGSNINKVFGGFFASISGNYITLYDLSQKYEMTDSLSKKQLLVVVALLFGRY